MTGVQTCALPIYDIKQRIAESFETCLSLTDGIAIVAPMDSAEEQEELIFSSRFACPMCGYSISELEPRMFSFNNPSGACQTCDGLGVKQFFDPSRVVRDGDLTIAEGAIKGWDRRTIYYFQLLTSVMQHYDQDIDTKFKDIPVELQDIILNGSGKEQIGRAHV